MARKRVAVLISGRGSNMAALIEAAKAADYPAEIVLVISNRADAAGVALAAREGIAAVVVESKAYSDKPAFENAIERALKEADVDLIALAGFMRILSSDVVARWHGRVINIHPSLLPALPGLDTHARAIASGSTKHGCSVHFVGDKIDDGPVIAQAEVPVLPGDTPATLAARVLAEEHKLYPRALALVASGRVHL